MPDINSYQPSSGRKIKDNGQVVNTAEMIESIYKALVINKDAGMTLIGSNGARLVVNPDGTIGVKIAGASDDASGAIGTILKSSQIMQPVDIQAHYSALVQTHTSQAVAPSATSVGSWIDTHSFVDGGALANVSATVALSAASAHDFIIEWSHDGSVVHFTETKSGTGKDNGLYSDIKARWIRTSVKNTGAAPITANAHNYFKA